MNYLESKCKCSQGKVLIDKNRLERGNLCKEVIHSGGQGCDYFKPHSRCCGMCMAWYECVHHGWIPCSVVSDLVTINLEKREYPTPDFEIV